MASVLTSLTPRGRIALVAAAIGVLAVTLLLFRLATSPSWSTVAAGVDPAQTEKITGALDERGIAYELRDGGTAIAVERGNADAARVALRSSGAAGAKDPGYEIFDKQKLGSSEFQQQVDYQRALEGEISRTIEQVDGVGSAQLQLVLPEEELFQDEKSRASAAVLLSGGENMDPAAVRGVAQLVSSSVKGLAPSAVTITDGTGQLLWPQGDGAAGVGGPTSRASAEGRFEAQLDARLTTLLAQTLGSGKARVQSSVDLNTDEATRDELQYAKTGTPLKTTSEEEKLEGQGPRGVAGANGNLGAAAAGGGPTNYESNKTQTDYGVNKTVTRVKVAPGRVERLSLAVLIDKSVKPEQVEALEDALATAAGIDDERGDTISMTAVEFAKPPKAAAKSGLPVSDPMTLARNVGAGLLALLFLLFAFRAVKRRESDPLGGDPTWLREISAPIRVDQLEKPTAQLTPPAGELARKDLGDIARTEPDRVAAQVRAWMADE